MKRIKNPAVGVLLIFGVAHAANVSSGSFKAELNPVFPGLVSFEYAGNSTEFPKNDNPVLRLNGKDCTPEVKLTQVSPSEAVYDLAFPELKLTLATRVVISGDTLTLTIENVREQGAFALRTIEVPGLTLLHGPATAKAAIANFPASSYASEKPEDHDIFGKVSEIEFKDNEKNKTKNCDAAGNRGASYVFLSDGKTAAGLYSNVMEENLRMIVKLNGEGEARTFSAAPGKWTYREIPTEVCPTPTVKLVVSIDANADGVVNWQDAAIAYRRAVPQPYGGEKTKDYAIAHIAMNFGSQATNPFLRVLDNAKKIWLYTDGLGQRIQYKGFAGEGHDSSHPDYAGNVGKKMGGREDLNFVMRRGHDFDVQSGVHINAHEYHKEAKWFSPDIADLSAIGWSWLDESYLTNYRYDSAYGTLYQRLDAMREDLPWLDFVYLDVYYGRGWPGWRMYSKNNSNGILQFTEFPGVMESGVVWNHVANDWTQQIGGKGDRSEIARFIWFSQKDTFKHGPLLRGTNCDGFMGWHGERSMLQTIKSAFTVNLPTKYLQFSQLIRQEKDKVWFSNGSRVESDGTFSKLFGRDGQLINSCRYEKPNTRPIDNLTFIPWNPNIEEKIYHWSDKGGESTWELPKSWAGRNTALLYRLTDLGRVFERELEISNGKIVLTDILPETPYVLCRDIPTALPGMKWGEGAFVKDPGFDSHSFTDWLLEGVAIVENHKEYGQSELIMAGPKGASVRQTLLNLTPGQTYAASAWVSIDGQRDVSISVEDAPITAPPFVDKQAWKIVSSLKSLGGDKPVNMLDGKPDTQWHSAEIGDSTAKLSRWVTLDFGKSLQLTGFSQTCRADKGNGAIKGYLAETSVDGKIWAKVSKGDFDYGDGTTAIVKFLRPTKARYFRLTATSTLTGKPFISIAELDPHIAMPGKVESGFKPVFNAINQTHFSNHTDQSSKYERNWHRLKVVFTAPADGRADVVLRAGQGAVKVSFDDVRVVKTLVSKVPTGKVVLFEDFENCDEAWGPFMYGWHGPMNTHLSEANPPYTNDTIRGTYSLKSRFENSPDLLYRTVPATLKLKPNTTYKVSFDYLCDNADCFAFFAGPDATMEVKPAAAHILKDGSWTVKTFSGTFKTDSIPDWFIAITKLAKDNKGIIVIDNVLVTE